MFVHFSSSIAHVFFSLFQTTYKLCGFPIPYFITGRWGFLPFPSRVPLLYILGAPIEPRLPPTQSADKAVDAYDEPSAASCDGTASEVSSCVEDEEEAAVESLHRRFYASLEDLYKRYRHLHPSFHDAPMRIIWQH